MKYTQNDIIHKINALYEKLGRLPNSTEYKKEYKHNLKSVTRMFGSWNNALLFIFGKENRHYFPKVKVICKKCNKEFSRIPYNVKRSNNQFCSIKCSISYRNVNAIKTNRSKFELYTENRLKKEFPNLKIKFNDRSIINGLELDIYFPDLKLGIELNGTVHYEPIYGEKSFNIIQNRDKQKIIRCYEYGIELAVINTSKMSAFRESVANKYYMFIKDVVDLCIRRISD